MGCCFVSETKDDFKGFRIIKDQRQKFGLKEISNQNSKSTFKIIKYTKKYKYSNK